MTVTQQAALGFIKSAITGQPQPLPEDYTLSHVAALLYKNGLITLGYAGASICNLNPEDPVMIKMQDFYCVEFLRSEQQLAHLDRFYQALEEKGIEYMPVKGAVMKHIYPAHEQRTMSDADILIHAEQKDELAAIMESLGYTFCSESDHEWNWAIPELKLELHKRLVSSDEKNYYSYFGDGWEWAKTKEGCRWSMSQEDAFIFEFSHFTRHYCKGGIGVRHMVDLWVHLYNAPNMDKVYVRKQMDKLRLGAFYDNVMAVIQAWFYDGDWTPEAQYISDFVFGQGKVSHNEEVANSAIAGNRAGGKASQGKFRMLMRRLFPARKHLDWNYPQLKKVPLPFAWVARWFSLLTKKNVVKNRINQMNDITDESVNAYRQSLEFVGLEVME